MIHRTLIAALVAIAVVPAVQAEEADRAGESDRAAPRGNVVLLHRIDMEPFGPCRDLRLGDLEGDGRLDLLVVQNHGQEIRRLIALDLTGKVLWRVGDRPVGAPASSDVAVQIHDLDGDGRNNVVYVGEGRIRVLEGKTGKTLREAPLPAARANDCLAFADFAGSGHAGNVVVKDRYRQVWALNEEFEVLWTWSGNPGHYCWPHDVDGDGRDELIAGYTLLGPDGKELWSVDLPGHADAVAVADVDGNTENGPEIAYATCGGNVFALAGADGTIRWKHPCRHSQHVVLGDFRSDLPGREMAAVDRGNDRSASGVDTMLLYSAGGEELWREQRTDPGEHRWLTIITTVRNWDGKDHDLILGYRRGGSTYPTLYDGHGDPVATFPIPPPEMRSYAQHADVAGDAREEIVVWNEGEIRVYGNGDPPPAGIARPASRPNGKRLYNYTYYIGMP